MRVESFFCWRCERTFTGRYGVPFQPCAHCGDQRTVRVGIAATLMMQSGGNPRWPDALAAVEAEGER